MNHIDLFSGIAGFALAAREVWGEDYHNILFCDNNRFVQEVIKKNFGKDSVIYGDIRQVTSDTYRNRSQVERAKLETGGDRQFSETIADTDPTGLKDRPEERGRQKTSQGEGQCGFGRCDLLTGGFPCQPFSQAGKRRGTEDNRYLWPEMLRVIKDFSPRWVIAENVRGLVNISNGVVFEQVCADLENAGYQVQPFIIPAVAVNAPHRRDRVWIIANAVNSNNRGRRGQGGETDKVSGECRSALHAQSSCINRQGQMQYGRTSPTSNQRWETNWLEVATSLCGMDDEFPDWVDKLMEIGDLKLTKAGHRVERLKSLGNAIVPAVAIEIMKAIKQVEAHR